MSLIRWAACLACAALLYGQAKPAPWQPLFDGKSFGNWRETPFSGHGKARVENGTIVLGAGRADDRSDLERQFSEIEL